MPKMIEISAAEYERLNDCIREDGMRIAALIEENKALHQDVRRLTAVEVHGQWIGEADGYADGELVYAAQTIQSCYQIIAPIAARRWKGRRMPNDLQANPVQHRYGTSHSGGPEDTDAAGDKAAAHKPKMEQYWLARLG